MYRRIVRVPTAAHCLPQVRRRLQRTGRPSPFARIRHPAAELPLNQRLACRRRSPMNFIGKQATNAIVHQRQEALFPGSSVIASGESSRSLTWRPWIFSPPAAGAGPLGLLGIGAGSGRKGHGGVACRRIVPGAVVIEPDPIESFRAVVGLGGTREDERNFMQRRPGRASRFARRVGLRFS